MAERKIGWSNICILGDPLWIRRENGIWILDEVAWNIACCRAANNGAVWQRLLPYTVWSPHPDGMESQFQPYFLSGGKPDLVIFNEYYFPIVRRVMEIAKSYGIRTAFCLADNCQFLGPWKQWSPWVNNVQGIGSIYWPQAQALFRKFIDKCIIEFTPFNPYWSWGNEMNNPGFVDVANESIFFYLSNGKMAAPNCFYGATMKSAPYVNGQYTGTAGVLDILKKDVGEEFCDALKLSIWREVHGIGEHEPTAPPPHNLNQALAWWGNHPIKIVISNDGCWKGDSVCDVEVDDGKTKRGPSAARWARIIKECRKYTNSFLFEYMPQTLDMDCQVATLRAMHIALYDAPPVEQYHYDPPLPPPPPPEPPLPPPPPPPSHKSFWQKIWDWIKEIFT